MKILITGYRGFIGTNLWHHLSYRHDLVGYEWGEEDYSLHDIDRVIHLGAITSTTTTDTAALLRQNVYFTEKLVKSCSMFDIPMIIASSASVYGTNNTTFHEDDTPSPMNHYAWSKVMVEEFCRAHSFRNPIVIFRYFNVYGPWEGHKGAQASPYYQFNQQALNTGVIKVFEGSENFYRDFVPVHYLSDVTEKFLDYNGSGIFNLGTGQCKSFMDVAQEVGKHYNCKIETIPMPEQLKASYQRFTRANTTKLLTTLDHIRSK